jgi:hypothetical protein
MGKDICPSCEKRYEDGPDGLCSVCRGEDHDHCPGCGMQYTAYRVTCYCAEED